MAHPTEIKVFLIAQTRVNWKPVHHWLAHLGLTVEQVAGVLRQISEPAPASIPSAPGQEARKANDAEALVALCGKRCYNSFVPALNPNVSKIREDMGDYIRNILKSGHGSVLEHATFTFAIEGCTRVFTPEMNRHRAGTAISEGSLRYIRLEDIAYWLPPSLTRTPEETEALRQDADGDLADKELFLRAKRKERTEQLLAEAFESDEKIYLDLCNLWDIDNLTSFHDKKKLTSMFRRIVGMGMATGGVWTMNVRALRHILASRTAEGAEEEIRWVFDLIADIVVEELPFGLVDFARNEKGEWIPAYPKV